MCVRTYKWDEKEKSRWFMEQALQRARKYYKMGQLDKILLDQMEKMNNSLKKMVKEQKKLKKRLKKK